MTDDVIFSLPLLSMTLIMSEKYHQELRTSTLSFNASSRFLSIRIAGFYLLKSFIRSLNIFKEILCFFAIFVNPEFFTSDEAETTLGMSHNPRPHICLEAAAITREHILDWRVLGVLLLILLHPVLDVGLVPALLHEAVVPGPALVPLVCL